MLSVTHVPLPHLLPGLTGRNEHNLACTSKTLPTFEAMWASLVSAHGQENTQAAPASSIEEEQ